MKRRPRAGEQRLLRQRVEYQFGPITLSPWRMRMAKAAASVVTLVVRCLLRLITFLARFAVVKAPRRGPRSNVRPWCPTSQRIAAVVVLVIILALSAGWVVVAVMGS